MISGVDKINLEEIAKNRKLNNVDEITQVVFKIAQTMIRWKKVIHITLKLRHIFKWRVELNNTLKIIAARIAILVLAHYFKFQHFI